MTTETTDSAVELLEQWLACWGLGERPGGKTPRALRDRTYLYVKTHPPGYEVDEQAIEAGARAMLAYENNVGINEYPRDWYELTSTEQTEYSGYAEAVLKSAVTL